MKKDNQQENLIDKPPIVVVMGHIDHGKSTLLDYIRKTNTTEKEIGGITQNISAYEIIHKDEHNKEKKITFLDTPGHEAFLKMRERGGEIANIAILVVSADDGVKIQTIEAWKTILKNKLDVIIAINKIDKPDSDVERTKIQLAENEIYLENYGGTIPYVEISAKTGVGVDNLLSLILLIAEMKNLKGNINENASGYILETNLDSKRGILGNLIIKDGCLKKGNFIVVEDNICSIKIMENFKGEIVDNICFSSPVRILGFNKIPTIGKEFKSFLNKKDAEKYVKLWQEQYEDLNKKENILIGENNKKIIPILLKADVSGMLEAIEKEIDKLKNKTEKENIEFKIISKGIGQISESDIKSLTDNKDTIIIGFNVDANPNALLLAEKKKIAINFFNIIYKMSEWLEEQIELKKPKTETIGIIGKIQIIRAFSRTKNTQVIGGKVIEGKIILNGNFKIMRREFEIGNGKIINLEKNKVKTNIVEENCECGMMVESKIEIVHGDILELFSIIQK